MNTATLIDEDMHLILNRLPRDVRKLLADNQGFVLAGGFIRATIAGERVSDIDILGPSKDLLKTVATELALARHGRLHETQNAYTVLAPGKTPIQFIHRWTYDAPAKVVDDFDFTIAMAGIWAEFHPTLTPGGAPVEGAAPRLVWCSKTHPLFYPDLASKRLRYMAPNRAEDAGGSLLRARKFLQRGYHIEAPSLAGVITRAVFKVRDTDQTNTEEGHTRVLIGVLREVDPLTVIDGLELVDEHQVHPTA